MCGRGTNSTLFPCPRWCAPPPVGAPPRPWVRPPSLWCAPPPVALLPPPFHVCTEQGAHAPPLFLPTAHPPVSACMPFVPPSFEHKQGMQTRRANWGGAQTVFASMPPTPHCHTPLF